MANYISGINWRLEVLLGGGVLAPWNPPRASDSGTSTWLGWGVSFGPMPMGAQKDSYLPKRFR